MTGVPTLVPLLLADALSIGPHLLLHAGPEGHGHINIWVLVTLGVVGNAVYYGVAGPGMLLERRIRKAIRSAFRSETEVESLRLPHRRGELSIENVRLFSPEGSEKGALLAVAQCTAPLTVRMIRSAARSGTTLEVARLELRDVELRLAGDDDGSYEEALRTAVEKALDGPAAASGGRLRVRIREVVVSGLVVHPPGAEPATDPTERTEGEPRPIDEVRLGPVPADPEGASLPRTVAGLLDGILKTVEAATGP